VAVLLGIVIRAAHVLRSGFPLNDGGLFYQMARDLQANGFRLPATTTYNDAGLPFAYPPLAFYLAGLLDSFSPIGLMTWFRILPLLMTALTVIAFAALARTMLSNRAARIVAVFAFAVLPRSFIWMLMGGGVARSIGLLCAILALQQCYLLYRRRALRYAPLATLFCALTVLSHLETGWFLSYSIALFFLFNGRHRAGTLGSVAITLGTVVLTAPWWGAVVKVHGVAPFLAAHATGGSVITDESIRTYLVVTLLRLGQGYTSETLFPVVGSLAVLGLLACVVRRRWLLPVWWAQIILMDVRAFPTYASLPIAMLAGIGVAELLVPALRAVAGSGRGGPLLPHHLTSPAVALALGGVLVLSAATAMSTDQRLGGENTFLVPLSPDERAAMRWVAAETPPASQFLLVTAGIWPADKQSEWFPVLAHRSSVATVQGYEWERGGVFARRVAAYDEIQVECAIQELACLERWTEEHAIPFTHIYVPNTPRGQCCWRLRQSLARDQRFREVFAGPGASIFARRTSDSETVPGVAHDR